MVRSSKGGWLKQPAPVASKLEMETQRKGDVPGILLEVEDFGIKGWSDPSQKSESASRYCEWLEGGGILFFRQTPFDIGEDESRFLKTVRQKGSSFYKNVSYWPAEDRVTGYARNSGDANRLNEIMRRYSEQATRFAVELMPRYAQDWKLDLASFRPLEERGREAAERARNDLLHVDAFPTRPTNGNRILRVFTNINPAQPRIWVTGQDFASLARDYALDAGLGRQAARQRGPARRILGSLSRAARSLGIPLKDRAPYDRFMVRFHDYLKRNREFQRDSPKSRIEFPPGSTWIVFTDMVAHSVLSGQFALEHTYIVPRSSLLIPANAPVSVLELLCGAPLTS